MSKILHLIPLYGRCSEYILNWIQKYNSEAMQQVTRKRWVVPGGEYVSMARLLKECGWLSVRQFSLYTTVLYVHKTILNKIPESLYEKLTSRSRYETRRAAKYKVKVTRVEEARLKSATTSFRGRGHTQHSSLHDSLKWERNMDAFKNRLKVWVRINVPIQYNLEFVFGCQKSEALRCHELNVTSSKNYYSYYNIWQKSARIGKILNPIQNFSKIESPRCAQNGPFKEVSLLFQVPIVDGSPKMMFIPVDPSWMTRYRHSRMWLFQEY